MPTTRNVPPSPRFRLPRRRRAVGALAVISLVSLGGVVAGAQPAFAATTYYVDGVNGVDTFSGTAAVPGSGGVGPFKTIQKCADEAGPGDVCSIRGGTYRERVVPNSGTDGAPVTFRAHNDEPVTVTGLNRITSAWAQHSGRHLQDDRHAAHRRVRRQRVPRQPALRRGRPHAGGPLAQPGPDLLAPRTGPRRRRQRHPTPSWTPPAPDPRADGTGGRSTSD
jgi:hypothetical protein